MNCVAFHTEGNCVASGSSDRTIKMWDSRSHLLIQHYPAHEDAVQSISMHSSGYYLLSASKDSSLKIWDLREGRLLFTLQGHQGPVNSARFSKDGHFFASGGSDQLVMVWKSNLYGVEAPVIEWGQGERPRSAPQVSGSRDSLAASTTFHSSFTGGAGAHTAATRSSIVPKAQTPTPKT